jgi:hypothetical protein
VKPARLAVACLVVLAAGPALVACGSDSSAEDGTGGSGVAGGSEPNPSPSSSPEHERDTPTTGDTQQEDDMRIEITVGEQRFQATLDESAASKDLADLLPVTVEMRDHGSVEKTGRLPSRLSLDGQPAGADPDVGDVGYYSPGNNLVLYYGDQSYYDGIVILGQMDSGVAERIAGMEGDITVTVSTIDD